MHIYRSPTNRKDARVSEVVKVLLGKQANRWSCERRVGVDEYM